MERDFEILQQDVIEMAEHFCGGFVSNYKHAIEKLRESFLQKTLSLQTNSLKLFKPRKSCMKDKQGLDENTEELMGEIKKCKQIILSQHERISMIPQLENEIKDSERKLAMEVSKITNKFQNEIAQCNKELKQHHKLIAQNSQNEEKIKVLTMEIDSFRRQFQKEIDSGGRASQLQELAASRGKEIQKLEIISNRLKVKITLKDQEIQKLNNKILILEKEFDDLKKTKKTTEVDNGKENEASANLSLAKMLKKKLEEKEIELKKMSTRISKMQRIEIQCKLKEEGFQCERKEYLDRIAELCRNNAYMEKMLDQGIYKLNSKDPKKKNEPVFNANYENMIELTKSATDAYLSLASREKTFNRSTRPTTAGNESKWSTRVSSARKLKVFA